MSEYYDKVLKGCGKTVVNEKGLISICGGILGLCPECKAKKEACEEMMKELGKPRIIYVDTDDIREIEKIKKEFKKCSKEKHDPIITNAFYPYEEKLKARDKEELEFLKGMNSWSKRFGIPIYRASENRIKQIEERLK